MADTLFHQPIDPRFPPRSNWVNRCVTLLLVCGAIPSLVKAQTAATSWQFLGDAFTVEATCQAGNVRELYRHEQSQRKLHGYYERELVVVLQDSSRYVFRNKGFIRRGYLHGVDTAWINNTLDEVRYYNRGIESGLRSDFYDEDRVVSTIVDGVKHGRELEYVGDRLTREVNFTHGIKSGTETCYDEGRKLYGTARYRIDTIIPSVLEPYMDRSIQMPENPKTDVSLRELMRFGQYQGTIHAAGSLRAVEGCTPYPFDILDDGLLASFFHCSFPIGLGEFYLIQISEVDLDMIDQQILLAYPLPGVINRYHYVELHNAGRFTGRSLPY